MREEKGLYTQGMRDGIPIGLGYFAVALTIGIAAKSIGFTAVQGMVASLLNFTSAGEFAAMSIIAAGGGYLEVAIMTLVANARYMLMSCALSQKLDPGVSFFHRLIIPYGITDELFGLAIAQPGYLTPRYAYGAALIATIGWSTGTFCGVLMGEFLPTRIVSALSVGLFGMFLAVITPKARESRIVAVLIAISFVTSFLASRLAILSIISSGAKTIILTVAISLAAAILCPVQEEGDAHDR